MRLLTLLVLVASTHVLSAQDPNPCDDGNPATTDYIDDEGRCHHIYNLCCDDGDPTTIDRVNPETGECENIPDPSLLDCDGDGVADQDEDDCNENGVPDDCEQLDDCNNNGVPDECENLRDFNNNGIPDECEDCNENGIPDYRDPATDCNRNGIPDECENLRDCNNNGWPDVCEPLQDCNNNGFPDECEDLPDCDGNGIADICQDDYADCNGNGIMDKCEGVEDCNNNGVIDACEPDTDKDGIIDDCDVEECDGVDNDGDGFIDEGFDADKDGIKDCFDVEICNGKDDDGDGEIDEDFPDTDGDGVPDCRDNCPDTPNPDQADTDGDMMGDACDDCNDKQDADGDMVPDCRDNCINTPNPDQKDSDGDGVGDACDNCIDTPNPGQENADGDEYGDACDPCPNDAANKCNDCTNVIDGGAIKGNQTGCGEFDPEVIMSTREPAFQQGESADIEYMWMKSTVNVPFDPTDPNTPWEMVPNSDNASYDPGVITETTYFQRCARGVNCNDFVGESNVVVITITPCEICDGIDNDGDGDIDEGFPDTDKDGIADCADECDDRDDDNDGVPNCDDICLLGDDNLDADNDGVPDACDTCPYESNPGAEQDADDDNDGVPNACDNCAEIGNGPQMDTDQDGVGDACDICAEGDDNADSDGDGIPDACDTEECDNMDNDGDGMIDEGLICDGNCSVGNPMQDCDVATIQYIISSNDDCGNPTQLVIPVPECVSLGDVSVMGEYSSVAMGDSDCEFYPGESAIVITLAHGDGAPYIVEVSIEGTSYQSGNGTIGTTDGDRCSITDNMPKFVCFDYDASPDEDNDGIPDECDDCINFTASIDKNRDLDCTSGDNPTVLTASPTGGSYQWEGPDGNIINGATTSSITVTEPGNYSVTVSTGVDCEDDESVTVTEDVDVPSLLLEKDGDLDCDNNSVTLTATTSNASYKWYKDGSLLANETSSTLVVTMPGNYKVMITDLTNGCTNMDEVMVTEETDCDSDCVETSTSEDCDVATITYTLSKTDLCGDPSHFVIKVPDCVSLEDITVTGEAEANGVTMDNGPCNFFPGMKVVKIDIDQNQGGSPYVVNVSIKGTAISATGGMIGVKGGNNCTETSDIPGFVCYDYDAATDEDEDGIPDECDECVNFKPGDDGGDIAENQMICKGETPDELTSLSLPSGHGQGDIEYIWVKYEGQNPPPNVVGNNDWVMISGETGETYQPGALMTTTWFIRCARRAGCDTYWAESNMVRIKVKDTFEAGHDGGVIEDDQMICEGEKPNNLTNVQLPAGGYDENQLEFVWMFWEGEGNPPANVVGNNDWQPWPNSDSKDLHIDDVMFSTTTWFIRCARVKGCGGEFWAESNKVAITVEECTDCTDFEATLDKNMDWNCYSEGLDPEKSRTFLTAYPEDAVSYQWDGPYAVTTTDDDNIVEIPFAGTYSVTVTSVDGCVDEATITVNEDKTQPNVSFYDNEKLTCANNFTVELQVNIGSFDLEDLSFNWHNATPDPNDPSKATVQSQSTVQVSVDVQNLVNGCIKTLYRSVELGNNHVQTPQIYKDQPNDLSCNNTEVQLSVQPTNYANYEWKDSEGNTLQNGTSSTYNATEAGTYKVIVTDANNGCTAENTITVSGECDPVDNFECPTLANDAEAIHVEWIDCYTIVVCTGKDLSNVRLDYGDPGFDGQDPNEGEIYEDQSGKRNVFTSNKPIIGVWVKAGSTTETGPPCQGNGCGQYWSAPDNLNCDDLADPASQRASQGLDRANANQLEQGTNVSLPKVGIWPNPTVDGNLNLDLSDYAGENAFIQIYDMNGTIVYSNEFREVTSETYQILIEDLESGLYKLRTMVKGQPMTHTTFVVQNK